MGKYEAKSAKGSKKRVGFWILLLLLILGTVTLALGWNTWFGDKSAGPSAPQTANFDIDENAASWNGQQLPDKTTEPPAVGIKIPGYPSITLPADQQTVNMALLNPEGNPCYFTFEIVLQATGESLYKSKLVPPGQAITEVTLSRALSAGEYEATIQITTTSVADGSAMNGANVETVLTVK
ncbi:MAG: hypothetical protein U0N82_04265 [Oscillospiraceae bacterium]